MCDCKKCECVHACSQVSGFKRHMVGGSGELDAHYYAHHFDVGSVDDQYYLPRGEAEEQVLRLRLVSSAGGVLRVDVDHLSGNMDQVQLAVGSDWAELHYKCCQWHLADHQGATCT